MKGKQIASLIAYIVFGLLSLAAVFFMLGGAFNAGYAINVESHIINSWGWKSFNIILYGLIVLIISLGIIVIMLAIQDEKQKRPARRRYN